MSGTDGNIEIDIGRDFSRFPGGRYARHGKYSGEEFRDGHLAPALRQAVELGRLLVVRIDGVRGYGSAFLEEAFGGLIRESGFSPEQLDDHLAIVTDDKRFHVYKDLIERYLKDAAVPAAG
jgi:hypothetical protein